MATVSTEYRDREQHKEEEELKEFDDLDDLEELEITAPQLSGDAAMITCLRSSEVVENLALYARLDGCNIRHMHQVCKIVKTWMTKVENGALPTCLV